LETAGNNETCVFEELRKCLPATVRTKTFCLPFRYQKYKAIKAQDYNSLLLYSGVKLGLSHYAKNTG
jgi:hypothetical protein